MSATDDDYERLRVWSEVIEDANYYEILGLLELADTAAIKEAFKEFALAFHPDMHLEAPPEIRACVRHLFRRGAEAYRVLGDPTLREKYDLAVARGEIRLGEPSQRPPPPDARRSLEDVCRSPAAKLSAMRADREISAGNFTAARHHLNEALAQDDYDNPELEERIEALDLARFAMGQ